MTWFYKESARRPALPTAENDYYFTYFFEIKKEYFFQIYFPHASFPYYCLYRYIFWFLMQRAYNLALPGFGLAACAPNWRLFFSNKLLVVIVSLRYTVSVNWNWPRAPTSAMPGSLYEIAPNFWLNNGI